MLISLAFERLILKYIPITWLFLIELASICDFRAIVQTFIYSITYIFVRELIPLSPFFKDLLQFAFLLFFKWTRVTRQVIAQYVDTDQFSGGNVSVIMPQRANGSTVQVLLISFISIWRTLRPGETPRSPLSTSETDGTRSYKYQPAISHMCIANSRVTNTRSLPPPPSKPPPSAARTHTHTQFSFPFVSSKRSPLLKRFVPLLWAHLHRRLRRRTLRRNTTKAEKRANEARKKKTINERTCERRCLITCARQFAHAVRGKFFHGETLLYKYKVSFCVTMHYRAIHFVLGKFYISWNIYKLFRKRYINSINIIFFKSRMQIYIYICTHNLKK